jgi:hypothetical protein
MTLPSLSNRTKEAAEVILCSPVSGNLSADAPSVLIVAVVYSNHSEKERQRQASLAQQRQENALRSAHRRLRKWWAGKLTLAEVAGLHLLSGSRLKSFELNCNEGGLSWQT